MTKRLQQYFVLKFQSDRLRDSNYRINIDLRQARANGEIVSLGDSQVLVSVRQLRNKFVNEKHIQELFTEKRRLKRRRNSQENRKRIIEIEKEIDDNLYLDDIVSVVIRDNRHYQKMINDGFFINNRRYVRLLCGSGNARRNTTIWVSADIEKPLKEILNNGRDDIKLVPSKFNAYFALANSATLKVSEPRFCVIKDCEIKKFRTVDFVTEYEDKDDTVDEQTIELESNLFDGMGLISPVQSLKWSIELDLGYAPATWCIRGSFLKGMVCTFDFHAFADEVAHKYIIDDAWGNPVDIRDVDVVLTVSQLKLWNAYGSCEQYLENCHKNGIDWRVSRFSPKKDNTHTFTNYQFLQVLNIDDDQIKSLCQKTIDYFKTVAGGDARYSLLYFLGKVCNADKLEDNWMDEIDDPIVKGILLNNDLVKDRYVKHHILYSLNKKIKESYIGNLLVDGNYSVMISDPYAFCEHLFGLSVKGLLDEFEHYSNFWNNRGTKIVAAMRAPLTWRSEVNILHLKKNELTERWYKYLYSGIVYNVHGVDTMTHADSDFDMDLAMTTDQQEIIDGACGGLPITYSKKSVPKVSIVEDELYKADMRSFNSKIGYITNCSTSLYAMILNFEPGSREYDEIIKRLKICRKAQGGTIDHAKGLEVKPFPEHWVKFNKPENDVDEEQRKFNNSILIEKRPLFMHYLYGHYNKRYLKHKDVYNTISVANFGIEIDELLSKDDFTDAERKVVDNYYRYSYFIETPCVMNKICWYMEEQAKEIKSNAGKVDFDLSVLIDPEVPLDKSKILSMENLYKQYKSHKQNMHKNKTNNESDDFKTLDQCIKHFKQRAYEEISSNAYELACLAIYVCYVSNPGNSKDFVWKVFGNDVVELMLKNHSGKVQIPLLDENGDLEFLGQKYKMKDVEINVDSE